MEKILYDNVSLSTLVNTICSGLVALEEDQYLDDLIILPSPNAEENNYGDFCAALFEGIYIKPMIIDITESMLQHIAATHTLADDVETEYVDFVIYTVAKDEDGKKTIINKSLTEYLMMFKEWSVVDLPFWRCVLITK